MFQGDRANVQNQDLKSPQLSTRNLVLITAVYLRKCSLNIFASIDNVCTLLYSDAASVFATRNTRALLSPSRSFWPLAAACSPITGVGSHQHRDKRAHPIRVHCITHGRFVHGLVTPPLVS